ncbi:hypothetical protein EZV62_019646 [Acer yangbiense]|uniref:Uncharacterized protein n=1 Tax=Acer yangbiense TaxID=1000413 RepID=A0A5C7HBE6_9ROSI|nr:hypothetical protein EZV62_019646 [Acer yangbiense]
MKYMRNKEERIWTGNRRWRGSTEGFAKREGQRERLGRPERQRRVERAEWRGRRLRWWRRVEGEDRRWMSGGGEG